MGHTDCNIVKWSALMGIATRVSRNTALIWVTEIGLCYEGVLLTQQLTYRSTELPNGHSDWNVGIGKY
jgi:hypothetical protein